MPAATAALPQGIEIFREGTHVDDAGVARTYTRADLAASAAAYDPKVHDAPLTIGHPKLDEPRYGSVAGLQVRDGADGKAVLTMSVTDLVPAFAEAVTGKLFPKRSTAFYPPDHPQNPKPGVWYVRHVGFLGAQPPAVKGLADLPRLAAFSDGGAPLACFSETTHEVDPMDKELQAQLDAEKAAREKAEKAAADATAALQASQAAQRQARHAEHVAFAEGQAKAGKLTKPEVVELVAMLDLVAAAETVQFGEGADKKDLVPVPLIKRLVERAAPLANFSESAGGRIPNAELGAAKGKSDAEIHEAALAYSLQHKVAYSEALSAVTFTTTA